MWFYLVSHFIKSKFFVFLKLIKKKNIDAGQVLLINSKNLTVKNLNLTKIDIGTVLYVTIYCKISNNIQCNNKIGIVLESSRTNLITCNNITYQKGVLMAEMELHSSRRNIITNNNFGTFLI